MEINGKSFKGPATDVVVIPFRGEDIVFTIQCVTDYSDFNKVCQLPEPKKLVNPKGETKVLVNDPKFQEEIYKHSALRTHWMILQSLKATEDLKWDTVDFDDPTTWNKYIDELEAFGFTESHIDHLISKIIELNGLDDDKLEEARKRFLATRQESKGQSSLEDALLKIPSGEPAKD